MVAGRSVGIDCSSSSARVAGSSVLGTRELAAPVVWFWSAAVGFWAHSGGSGLAFAWSKPVAPTGAKAAQSADSHWGVWPLPTSDVSGGVALFPRGGCGHWQPVSSRIVPCFGDGVARQGSL